MEGQQLWDSVYGERFMTIWSPPEGTVQFTARFLKKRLTTDRFQEHFPARRVLDLGCGNGAAVLFFAKLGYEAHGLDISKAAIDIGKEWFAREGVSAELRVGDAALPLQYPNGFFDVVTCFGVLDHVLMENALRAVAEVHRVLATPGRFLLTLAGTRSKKFGEGRLVAHNTHLLEGDWFEAGAIQHYFDEEEIRKLLAGRFRTIDIREVTQKKLTDQFTDDHWSARWHVTTEKI